MKKYKIENDEVIYAETSKDFTRELRLGSFFGSETPEIIFLVEFVERIKTYYGETVNCTPYDYDGFVSELTRIGFIKSVEEV